MNQDAAKGKCNAEETYGIETVIAALAGRWKLLIIFWLFQGPCRFNQLQRQLGAITHRTLTRQLNELREAGFIERHDFRTVPPHVEYNLTPLGHSLIPVLQVLHEWAAEHADEVRTPNKVRQKTQTSV